MSGASRALVVALSTTLLAGCVTAYQDGLGYRARRAVERGDIEAFDGLMAEAAEDVPRHAMLKPKRTVLTHFLEFAAHPRFAPILDAWRARGWVHDNATCAIARARYRHLRVQDPEAARGAAETCVRRARAAAYAVRAWEVEACLGDAPFLTHTSTAALAPYLEVVRDDGEPVALRRALLENMVKVFLQDVRIRRTNHPDEPEAGHRARAEAQRARTEARFRAILAVIQDDVDRVLLAAATAFAALELERASLTEGSSFLWRYALSTDDPARHALAYAWVRDAKSRDPLSRHVSLGLWSRRLEPAKDAFWYGCFEAPEVLEAFGRADVALTPLRSVERADDAARAACPEDARLLGPLPLKATLRGAVTASVAATSSVARVGLRMAADKRVHP